MNRKIRTMVGVCLASMLILSVFSLAISSGSYSASGVERKVSQEDQPFDPPVDGGEAHENRAENAAAHGAATFLRVEGYQPWAALVINAGDPAGVDAVTVSFEDETLTIEATDSNSTNHVTILINKAFTDEHLADSEGDLNIETSDAVNYEGMNESNESAGGGGMYVFQVEEFSTQTIEISSGSTIPYTWIILAVGVGVLIAVSVVYYAMKKKRQ